MDHDPRQHGFSLVEQVATLAVAAILIAMAVPSMARLVSRTATRGVEDALFDAAHLARHHAVMQAASVLLCPSRGGLACDDDGRWRDGWIVAAHVDRDGRPDHAVLARGTPPLDHVVVLGSRGRPQVRFRPDGSAAGSNITLLACPRREADGTARRVVISNAGRIREAAANAEQQARCAATVENK